MYRQVMVLAVWEFGMEFEGISKRPCCVIAMTFIYRQPYSLEPHQRISTYDCSKHLNYFFLSFNIHI